MTIVVRPVTLGDAPGLRDCVGEVAREKRYLAATQAFSLQETALYVARVIDAGLVHYVADDAARVVGWCDIVAKAGQAHAHVGVLGMGVVADRRGRGLGKRLIDAALEAARRRFEQVELSVFAGNEAACTLYRRAGFVERGRWPNGRKIDGAYDDVILMSLEFESTQ